MTSAAPVRQSTPLGWPGVRIAAWMIGVVVAIAQAVIYRNWVNGDAISYLDMSDAVPTGDWSRIVNGTWSPLYPFVSGVVTALFRPSAARQFAMAHMVNFFCFLFAFVCFEFLLRALLDRLKSISGDDAPPRWAVLAIAYALFLWGSLGMLTLMKPTPDMLMSGFLYLAAGLLVRLLADGQRTRTAAALGLALGLGYLAKAFMFPLGILVLGSTLCLPGSLRRRIQRFAAAAGVFAIVAGPYAAAVSRLTHHLTFSDAALVVDLSHVDQAGPSMYWQYIGTARGAFLHPPRKIFDAPPAFEFNRGLAVTQSIWFDPSYWVMGARAGFHPRPQARILLGNLKVYGAILIQLGGLAVVLAWLVARAGRGRGIAGLWRLWPLWGIAVVSLGAYALVHVEGRYIGAFLTLLWTGLLIGFISQRPLSPRALAFAVTVVVANLAALTVYQAQRDFSENSSKLDIGDAEAADALRQLGVAAGDHVARISPMVADGWARLARVSIIAEVEKGAVDSYWQAVPGVQQAVLRAFAAAGAKAVIAHTAPGQLPLPAGWRRLGSTSYSAFLLQ